MKLVLVLAVVVDLAAIATTFCASSVVLAMGLHLLLARSLGLPFKGHWAPTLPIDPRLEPELAAKSVANARRVLGRGLRVWAIAAPVAVGLWFLIPFLRG